MEEQVKPNPWGSESKEQEVKEEQPLETPKSNKLTYILIGLGALLVLAVGVLGFVVYKQAMTNPSSTTNTSSVSSSKETTSSSTSSSNSTSSNTASVSVSSAISSKYYKYNTNNGKYISFDYPDGASINITGYDDKAITSFKDIGAITISNSLVTISMNSGGFDDCRTFTYDPAVKNQLAWEVPSYKMDDGVPNYVGEKGTYNMKTGHYIFQNSKFEYMVIDLNDFADSKVTSDSNLRFAVLTKNTNSKYVSECVIPETSFFTPKWTVKLDQTDKKAEPIYLTCKANNTEDVKKCTEVLDRFITTFRVK